MNGVAITFRLYLIALALITLFTMRGVNSIAVERQERTHAL